MVPDDFTPPQEAVSQTHVHLTDDELSAYVDDDLTPMERRLADAHLAGCDACRVQIADLRALTTLLRGLPQAPVPRSFQLPQSYAKAEGSAWSRLSQRLVPMLPALRAGTLALALALGGVTAYRVLDDTNSNSNNSPVITEDGDTGEQAFNVTITVEGFGGDLPTETPAADLTERTEISEPVNVDDGTEPSDAVQSEPADDPTPDPAGSGPAEESTDTSNAAGSQPTDLDGQPVETEPVDEAVQSGPADETDLADQTGLADDSAPVEEAGDEAPGDAGDTSSGMAAPTNPAPESSESLSMEDALATQSVADTSAASTAVAQGNDTEIVMALDEATETALAKDPTASATATPSPTPTATATPSATATATQTATATPSATATATPTATPSPEPTATATPADTDSDENDERNLLDWVQAIIAGLLVALGLLVYGASRAGRRSS